MGKFPKLCVFIRFVCVCVGGVSRFRVNGVAIDVRVGEGWGLIRCLWSGPLEFNCWIALTSVFSCMYF